MPTTDESRDPIHATPGLLLVMTGATAVLTLVIVACLVVGEWWLLPPTMLALLGGTAFVIVAIGRTLGDAGDDADDPAPGAGEPPAAATPLHDGHAARRRSRYAPDRRATRR